MHDMRQNLQASVPHQRALASPQAKDCLPYQIMQERLQVRYSAPEAHVPTLAALLILAM